MTPAQPDYMQQLDALFGGTSAPDFLDRLLAGASTTPALKTAPEAVQLTEQQQRYGSYGTSKDIGQVDLSNADSVAEMAKRGGWADPKAFSVDMLDSTPRSVSSEFSDSGVAYDYRFKPEYARARGMGDGFSVPNIVEWVPDRVVNPDTETSGADQNTTIPGGYKVLAGSVQGQKRPTMLYYQYDKDGNFQGANFDVKEKGLEGAAPLINMGLMALGVGGGLGTVGSTLNSSLGLGLGKVGQAALGGAAVGGVTGLVTGQNPIKSAATGALGAGLSAFNPAAKMNITNPAVGMALNGAAQGAVRSVVNGQDVGEGMVAGAINGGLNGLTRLIGR